jgi:hypothetical protein
MMAAERCRIFRYGQVRCSSATATPSLETAEPLQTATHPTHAQLISWIASLEGFVQTLRAAPDTDSKVCRSLCGTAR